MDGKVRLIACVRPALPLIIAPQAPDTPQAKGRCGHIIYQFEQLMLGELIVSKPTTERFGWWGKRLGYVWQKCLECSPGGAEAMAQVIVCGMCGTLLLRGASVSMYMPDSVPDTPFWQHATHTANGKAVVGCMSMDCCPNGAFHAGTWRGDGIATPYVTGTALGDMFEGYVPGGMMIINH